MIIIDSMFTRKGDDQQVITNEYKGFSLVEEDYQRYNLPSNGSKMDRLLDETELPANCLIFLPREEAAEFITSSLLPHTRLH